jgi:integrase
MPRPRMDGTASRRPNRRNLTELFVRKVMTDTTPINVWDEKERGLVLRIHPTGRRAFKVVYSRQGRPRWYHIGQVGLSDARRIAAKIKLAVAEGKDPAAERRAERGAGTFAELANRYVEEHAKRKNKSWEQADYLVRRHLLTRWGKLDAKSITRADVKAMMRGIKAPVVANQTLAATSAIFTWAIEEEVGGVQVHPCKGVDQNPVQSRERVLSDSELPRFWAAFDDAGLVRSSALKVILLTGQRPGEVSHMRREHVVDGWWEMPGAPDHKLGWPGTKNKQSHRVWLPEVVRSIIAEAGGDAFVFGGRRPVTGLDGAMREICAELRVNEKATPHDLRRTHGTMITRLGFGRDAMNRIQNHKEGGIGSVYDRHEYAEENKKVMEVVAAHVMRLAS